MSSTIELLETGQVRVQNQLIPGITVETSQDVRNNNWNDTVPVYFIRLESRQDRLGFAYHSRDELDTALTLLHFYNHQRPKEAK
jgi:hypothetical protein